MYLRYSEIEDITERLLEDYCPDLLKIPNAIEYDDFLENYLEVNLDYQHIYSSTGEGDILGCSTFSQQKIAIFDKENMRKAYIDCPPKTVILDMSLVDGDLMGFRITQLSP